MSKPANRKHKTTFIIGCGAQCKYVMDIFSKTGRVVEMIFDPIGGKTGQNIDGIPISLFDENFFLQNPKNKNASVIICLSNNKLKKKLFQSLTPSVDFTNAIHPDSTISAKASIATGSIVNAKTVVQPYASISEGVMIHAGVIVEHDNKISNFVNLAPGVTLAGGVTIKEGATLYSGTVVAPNITIGQNAIIGAGSLVLNDIPDNVLAHGSPAKVVKELSL